MASGSITLIPKDGPSSAGIEFPLKPTTIRRDYSASYVPIPIALADWGPNTPAGTPSPVSWARNNPDRINIRALLVDQRTLGNLQGNNHIEDEITKLENFRYKSPRTNEPPDLVFTVGNRHDRVRVEHMTIDPILYVDDPSRNDLLRQQAWLDMTMIVIKPRQQ